jgi:hypothetical protein
MHSGSLHEGLHWIVQALDNPAGAPLERARAAWAGGHLALLLSEHAAADEMMRQLRSVAEREDHQELVAFVAFGAALKSFAERDLSSCVDLAESASRQLRSLGDHGSAAEALSLASMVAFLTRISAQLVHRKGSADFVAECAVVPPGHGGFVGEIGLAEDG